MQKCFRQNIKDDVWNMKRQVIDEKKKIIIKIFFYEKSNTNLN